MLTPCAGCRRHVEETESRCPFCGAAVSASRIVPVLEGRMSRAAVFASAVLIAPACVVNDPPPPQYVRQPPPPDDPHQRNYPPPDQPPPPNDPPPYESHDYAKPPPDDRRPPPDDLPPPPRDTPPPVANAVVRGRITMNGNPAAGIQIALHGGPTPVIITTDGNGSYFVKVPAGQYQMRVGAGGGAQQVVNAQAGRESVVNLAVAPYVRQNTAKPYGAPPARRRVV